MRTKPLIVLIIFIIMVTLGLLLVFAPELFREQGVVQNEETENKEPIEVERRELCYFKPEPWDIFEGKYTMHLVIEGDSASGEIKFLPALKDSKIGEFSGAIKDYDASLGLYTVEATWNTFAEGMNTVEEIVFSFDDKMVDLGIVQIDTIDCMNFFEIVNVEKYLRENIATLSDKDEVLGGTWYVLNVSVNPETNTGSVVYEDGHIQEKSSFFYAMDEHNEVESLSIE